MFSSSSVNQKTVPQQFNSSQENLWVSFKYHSLKTGYTVCVILSAFLRFKFEHQFHDKKQPEETEIEKKREFQIFGKNLPAFCDVYKVFLQSFHQF